MDIDDLELIKKYSWHIDMNGYFMALVDGKNVGIHQLIMQFPQFVDHINGSNTRWDNRKSNLRECTHQQNMCNRKIQTGGSSRFKGVHWESSRQKWAMSIQNNKRRIRKRFDTETEAALAYNEAALKLHGEFARLNVV